MVKRIEMNAYAKINWSLEILGKLPDGYHEISTAMQLIALHDRICVEWIPAGGPQPESGKSSKAGGAQARGGQPIRIEVESDDPLLPINEGNLAFRAAAFMAERFLGLGGAKEGTIRIDIQKNIPVGAGLGGGSADCAAVLLALSKLWGLGADISGLCGLGAELGADVPFCVMGQAAADKAGVILTPSDGLNPLCRADPAIFGACALATGTGIKLRPIIGTRCWLVISKPPLSVSTGDAYRGFDSGDHQKKTPRRAEALIAALQENNLGAVGKNMINDLENYTARTYSEVSGTKRRMEATMPIKAAMSGSGPAIFGVYKDKKAAEAAFQVMRTVNKETFLTETI